jgi:hypothetical protein
VSGTSTAVAGSADGQTEKDIGDSGFREGIHCHLSVFVVFLEVVEYFYIRSGIWFLALASKV